MELIPCFDHSPELKDKFKELLKGKGDLSESEQKELGKQLAHDHHQALDTELGKFKKGIGLSHEPLQRKDNTQAIKEINDKYDNQISQLKPTQNVIQEPGPSGMVQHPQEGTGSQGGERGGMEQSQQGEIPSEENQNQGKEPRVSGIAQRVQEQLGLKPYEAGKGWSKEESLSFGRAAIEHGIDPEKAATDPKYSDLDFHERMAVVQAHDNALTKEMYKAGDEFGEDSKQHKNAQKALSDFQDTAGPIRAQWAMAGISQQGEIDIDTDSFTGMKHSFTEYSGGKEPSEKDKVKAKAFVDQIKEQDRKIDDLRKQLNEAHQNAAKALGKPQREKLSTQLTDIAKRIRASAEFDNFLKGAQGDVQKMGIDLPRLKEIAASVLEDAAKAVKAGENAIDFIRAAVSKLKDDVDKDKLTDALTAIGEKEGLFDVKESAEARNVRRLEKELEDLRQGIAKQHDIQREPSAREKELHDEIFKAKQDLGLVPSKPLPSKPAEKLSPAERSILSKEKQLEDLRNGIVKQAMEKRKPTAEENKLDEQIHEAKKNLGLIRSKGVPAKPEPTLTPEEKHIKQLEKRLEDLQNGIVKEVAEKREQSPREKELQDKIFEAKKNLGLVPSKPLQPHPEAELTPAEKNIKRMEKELDDIRNGDIKQRADKRELTPEEKDLKEQLFEAKKNAGLYKSKQEIETPLSIEEKRQQLAESFVDKKGNDFTPEEASKIWDYIQDNYFDNGTIDMDDAATNAAIDLGLSREQVINAIQSPRGAKKISDAMYGEMSDRRKMVSDAEAWVRASNQPELYKLMKTIVNVPFAITTAYHGTVGMVTHAGLYIYDPLQWRMYFKKFGEQYPNAFGNKGQYEQKMRAITNDPMFDFWKRAKLQIDPSKGSTDDYLTDSPVFKKMAEYGTRGFNTLKDMRLLQAKNIWNKLSDAQKADPEMAPTIARMINLGSGTTGDLALPDWAGTASSALMFAPKLTASQIQRMSLEPVKAVAHLFNWKNATPSQRWQAKYVAAKTGWTIGTMLSFLGANQVALNMAGSSQKINFFHPLDSDWLKFKALGYSLDASGGMLSMIRFMASLTQEMVRANIKTPLQEKQKPADVEGRVVLKQLKSKESPFMGDVSELVTGTDYNGRPTPWSQVELTKKQEAEGITKHTVGSFIAAHAPIPVSEAYSVIEDNARATGTPQYQIDNIFKGFMIGALNGATGVRLNRDYNVSEEVASPLPPKQYKKD